VGHRGRCPFFLKKGGREKKYNLKKKETKILKK